MMKSKKKNNPPQKNQPSIKEQLQAHRKRQEEERAASRDTDIDHALLEYNDISVRSDYEVSMMARVWFREHSNFNEVLDLFIEHHNLQNHPKNSFVDQLVRYVMDLTYRVTYPYNTFKFHSPRDCAIAKELLTYPAIEKQEDLDRIVKYFSQHRISFSTVNMDINNQLNWDIRKVIEAKRARYGPKKLYFYHKLAKIIALRNYYESKNTVEYIDLQTITFEQMLEISDFDRTVRREMRAAKVPDDQFEIFGETLLEAYKTDPETRVANRKLFVKPHYYLICNYISQAQEALISTDVETFYRRTNASSILRQYEEEFSQNIDESFDEREKKEVVKKRFFLKYVRQKARNMPPFQDLYIKDLQEDEDLFDEQPQKLDVTPSKITYRSRRVCEKNSDPEDHSESSSSEKTVIENFHTEKVPLTIDQLLIQPNASQCEIELASMLAKAPSLILKIKEATKNQFPDTFEVLWTDDQRRSTFVHYLLYFLKNNPEPLQKLMESTLEDELLVTALKLFKDLSTSNRQEDFDNFLENVETFSPPNITSTQNAFQDEPMEPCESDDVVIVQQPKDIVLPTANVNDDFPRIKIEPISQRSPLKISNATLPDSDVLILSQHNSIILIESENEEEDSIIKMIRDDANDVGRDQYQMQLNQPSQQTVESETLESPASSTSEHVEPPIILPEGTTLGRHDDPVLKETYDLRIYQLRQEDRAAAAKKRKKKEEMQINPPRKRPKRNTANPISFVDSDEEVTPFTIQSSASNLTPENGASCFLIELQRVSFKKDYIFEISIHLPQFACYDILVKDENIQNALNLNDVEWQTLLNNLCIVGEYEFINGQSSGGKFSQSYTSSINRQLDLYFSSLSHIKSFQIIGNGVSFATQPLSSIPSIAKTSSAIDSNILKLISKEKRQK